MGHYQSAGMIWKPGEVPACEVCGNRAVYETPWSGVVLCDNPHCVIEYCVFTGFDQIEFVEDEEEDSEGVATD